MQKFSIGHKFPSEFDKFLQGSSKQTSKESANQDESTEEADEKRANKSESSLNLENLYEIQSKDIDEKTKILCKFFIKNKYPNKKELHDLVKKTKKPIEKIETWFKNRRRALANKGLLPHYIRKKNFKKRETKILTSFFEQVSHPNDQILEKLANQINSNVKHIKNWRSYNKKKSLAKQIDSPLNEEEKQIIENLKNETFDEESINYAKKEKNNNQRNRASINPSQPQFFINNNPHQMAVNPYFSVYPMQNMACHPLYFYQQNPYLCYSNQNYQNGNAYQTMNPLIIMTPMNQNYQGVANNIHNNQYAYHFNTFNQEEYNRERS